MLLFASHLKPRLRGPRKMLTRVLYFFIKDAVKSHSLTSKCLAADPQWYMRYTDLVSLSHLISLSVPSASFQCYLLTFPNLFPKRYTWCFRSFTVIYLHHFLHSTFFLPVFQTVLTCHTLQLVLLMLYHCPQLPAEVGCPSQNIVNSRCSIPKGLQTQQPCKKNRSWQHLNVVITKLWGELHPYLNVCPDFHPGNTWSML